MNMADQKQPIADGPDSGLMILFELAMCITMFKKGYTMSNKTSNPSSGTTSMLDLTAAVEQFVAQGGVIDVIHDDASFTPCHERTIVPVCPPDCENEKNAKLELLKELATKGAGISALQYSLRMNRKDIKQLAADHGIKIASSRPILDIKREAKNTESDIDDVTAGHAMHYSSLGYTAHEIARLLGLSVREVWNIGKAYRFEFKQVKDGDTP